MWLLELLILRAANREAQTARILRRSASLSQDLGLEARQRVVTEWTEASFDLSEKPERVEGEKRKGKNEAQVALVIG